MNITWAVLNMKGVDVGAPLGTVVTEVVVQITATEDTATASDKRSVKVCKPKLRPDGVTWYVPTVDPENFLQYDTVSQQDVITWVQNALGTVEVGTIESGLMSQVERILVAPVPPKPAVLTPPWE
jgi:hypothetical protein